MSHVDRDLVRAAGADLPGLGLVDEGPRRFRVHTRAYTDRAVFDAEMERIFGRSWVYVCHASEVPEPGDYRTAYVGLQPVIVVRQPDRSIAVLVNRCIHRAAVVCREGRGKADEFMCPYHGWVYGIDGRLVAISQRRDAGGYPDDFDAPEGLFRVPRVDQYRGFVFASFDAAAQPLPDFLGRGRVLIDRKLNLSPAGEIAIRSRPYVMRYQGNWKFQAENIVDAYHFMHTHKGFVALQAKFGDSTGDFGLHKGGNTKAMHQVRFRGYTWDIPNGHAQLERPVDDLAAELTGEYGEYYRALEAQHGTDEMVTLLGKVAGTVFPNMGMIHQQIRVWRPIAPDLTEVAIYPYELVGAPDSYNEGMLRSQERFYGPSGHGMPDDVDIFARNQQGLAGAVVPWLVLERGIDSDELLETGEYRGLSSSEAPQRALWRGWQRLMNGR